MRAWSQKEYERLEQMSLDGLSSAEIARQLGRTDRAVRHKKTARRIKRSCRLQRYLPIVSVPHTMISAAEALGVKKGAIEKAKRILSDAGFDIYYRRKES